MVIAPSDVSPKQLLGVKTYTYSFVPLYADLLPVKGQQNLDGIENQNIRHRVITSHMKTLYIVNPYGELMLKLWLLLLF